MNERSPHHSDLELGVDADASVRSSSSPTVKRRYEKPVLISYGRVVDMTRGGGQSPGEARGRLRTK